MLYPFIVYLIFFFLSNKRQIGWLDIIIQQQLYLVTSIGQNPYLLLSATCDEILSWMIESWMEKSLGKWQ